ncbi:MAG: CRISPR-associated endonuclease Cas2 [Leptospiraceae bacterium]|nr:CRISPR-associated endonuclease Cas2 [Leptospiraceae bacterium]
MKAYYLLMYDIVNPKRLQKIHKICKGYGQQIQYSVFLCQLTREDLEILKGKLSKWVNTDDQILFIRIKPVKKTKEGIDSRVISLGKKFSFYEDEYMII